MKKTLLSIDTYKTILLGSVCLLAVAVASLLAYHFLSIEYAIVVAVLCGFSGFLFYEFSSRKKWEKDLVKRLNQMKNSHARLARDVAKGRNDVSNLEQVLANVGRESQKIKRIINQNSTFSTNIALQAVIEQLTGLESLLEAEERDKDHFSTLKQLDKKSKNKAKKIQSPIMTAKIIQDEGAILKIVNHAVGNDHIDLFIQPVVTLPQRKLRFYEMLSRIPNGKGGNVSASDYLDIASKHNKLSSIDNLLLLRSMKFIKEMEYEGGPQHQAFFCNISYVTLSDPKFMGDLVEFLSKNRNLAPRVVFEMRQSDYETMSKETLSVLDGLSGLGCRFSMDDVTHLTFDFIDLKRKYIRFIKIDKALLMNDLSDDSGWKKLRDLKIELDSLGIDLIVNKIETEEELLEILDLGVDYGQGYLFGEPKFYT